MAVDLNRFHQVFFAESLEQLDAMEAELLRPDVEHAGAESINTIFRAAHSIKGGSATFGFQAIAALTHVLETLLDEARAGQRRLTADLVDLLLQAVDALRQCLSQYRSRKPPQLALLAALQQQFETLVSDESAPVDAAPEQSQDGWRIEFCPDAQIMLRGNDPYRLIRELATLGECTAQVNHEGLPAMAEIDPEQCYLKWTIELRGNVPKDAITEIFEWVEDDCELTIEPLTSEPQMATEASLLEATSTRGNPQATIRVDIDKIDQLINLVGELVITESMLDRQSEGQHGELQTTLAQLARNVGDLQDSALKMRMLPISFAFARLPRIVRDLSRGLGKQVGLQLLGEQTEVDKSVLEALTDPLTHLVRNAIDHGIESTQARRDAGKATQATITVRAYHEGGNVVVEVVDDGGGLDAKRILQHAIDSGVVESDAELPEHAIHNLIFRPGFSTSQAVSDVSGRGVGLDVVRRNVQDLGGSVRVESTTGEGTRFVLTLPLTLSIIDGQLVRIGDRTLIIPMLSIVQNIQVRPSEFESVGGQRNAFRFRDVVVPVADLAEAWELGSDSQAASERLMVVAEAGNRYVGLLVDELLEQQQVVIKSLEANFRAVTGVSAATILGDGSVALILDIAGLMRSVGGHERRQRRRQATETESNE